MNIFGPQWMQGWSRTLPLVMCGVVVLLLVAAGTQPSEAAQAGTDPYKILGVTKHATLQDIRRAYKQLAKEW